MEKVITDFIGTINFGDAKTHRNMAVIPLFTGSNHVPAFLTLRRALEAGHLVITEIGTSGSVPELLAKNTGDLPILLLDGEELAGAKQNRVLNTTILLREKSETVIPVSCTEHGRWSYKGAHFDDSDVIMAKMARENKARTVSDSLRKQKSYRSNQGQVWDDIAALSVKVGVHSETGAMRDVYESRKVSLDEYVEAFPVQDGQKGLLVMINGKIVGFDIIASSAGYADLHGKLIKSYAMDELASNEKAHNGNEAEKKAREFFEMLLSSREEKYKSIGYGIDYRFENGVSVGSALVSFEKVIHMAFFRSTQGDRLGTMSGPAERRANRSRSL
jgi:hypothetical protein